MTLIARPLFLSSRSRRSRPIVLLLSPLLVPPRRSRALPFVLNLFVVPVILFLPMLAPRSLFHASLLFPLPSSFVSPCLAPRAPLPRVPSFPFVRSSPFLPFFSVFLRHDLLSSPRVLFLLFSLASCSSFARPPFYLFAFSALIFVVLFLFLFFSFLLPAPCSLVHQLFAPCSPRRSSSLLSPPAFSPILIPFAPP